jgi:serine/threonine protein kinase
MSAMVATNAVEKAEGSGIVADASRVGSTVGQKHYRLDALVGKGGMAEVYGATAPDGSRVAVKILRSEYVSKPKVRDRFLQEAMFTREVNHPSVVRIFEEDYAADGAPFMVMDLLYGVSLQQYWRDHQRRLPLVEALRIVSTVVACLEASHKAGIVHRDLKPANVFLTQAGHVRVLDFGIAAFFGERAQLAQKQADDLAALDRDLGVGTPAYMSPEQAKSQKTDARSDLFSIGAMLHTLITGHRLHASKSERESLLFASTRAVPSVLGIAPNLPGPVAQVIDRALQWTPESRFQTASEMLRELTDVIELVSIRPDRMAPDVQAKAREPSTSQAQQASSSPPQNATPTSAAANANVSSLPPSETFDIEVENEVADATYRPDAAREHAPTEAHLAEGQLTKLRGFFSCIDAAASQMHVELAEQELESALRIFREVQTDATHGIELRLRPYGIAYGHEDVWTPSEPRASELYRLYAQGLRSFRLRVDLTFSELYQWVRLLLEPRSATSDIFLETQLSELQSVQFGFASLTQGRVELMGTSVTERSSEWASLDAIAQARLRLQKRSAASVNQRSHAAIVASDFDRNLEAEVHRLAGEAFFAAVFDRDVASFVFALRRVGRRLLRSGEVPKLLAAWQGAQQSLMRRAASAVQGDQLVGAFARALSGGENFDLLLEVLIGSPVLAPPLATMFDFLGEDEFTRGLSALERSLPQEVTALIARIVRRLSVGNEAKVLAALDRAQSARHAFQLAEMVLGAETDESRSTLHAVARREVPSLARYAAEIVLLDGPARLRTVAKQLGSPVLFERLVALEAIRLYLLPEFFDAIAQGLTDKAIVRDPFERTVMTEVMFLLSPRKAYEYFAGLARKGGLFANQSRDQHRAVAFSAIASFGPKAEAQAVLEEVIRARWTVSAELRQAAKDALLRLGERSA